MGIAKKTICEANMNKGSRQALARSTLRSCSDVVAAIIFALLLASCANVTFHPGVPDGTPGGTTPDLSRQTGLKYYTAKPYLLIGPTGNKDAPLKAEIISLPDLEHPTYAIYHPGWGQHIFSLAVSSNGNLSSYGQTADSKIPETIAALGSLMGGAGSLAAAIKPVASQMAATAQKNLAPTTSPKALVQAAIDELNKVGTATPPGPLVTDSAKRAEKLAADLKDLIENGQLTEDTLSEISGRIEKAKIDHPSCNSAAQTINHFYKQAQNDIDAAIKALQAGKPKPDFKLFEIQMRNGKTCLIPADCKLASEAIEHWGYSK
jgi:hypothetical protein